jgi:FMN phosphatase YigB (HAD superfamily)
MGAGESVFGSEIRKHHVSFEGEMKKTALITDLDNTLFDWVEIWYRSFSAMFEVLVEKTGCQPDELKNQIRAVHQRHGTSEYAFLLGEVPLLREFAGGNEVIEVFADAIKAYRDARSRSLCLYPTVMAGLSELKRRNCAIVAYTESMAFYTNYRIRKLNLDGVIDVIFSPKDHAIPKNMSIDEVRRYPANHYSFRVTRHEHTPEGELKPNPHILHDIIRRSGKRVDECVYVGDSLHKDVAMAKDAGVDHAWAKYGRAQQRPEYDLLREVTHWTDDDVEREKKISERDIVPDVVLKESFDEIFDAFVFAGE